MLTSAATQAQGFRLDSSGARTGGSFTSNAHNFHEADGFLNFDLPWAWSLGQGWRLQSRLDLSAGWLGDPGGNAFIGTCGPSLLFALEYFPLSFEAGVSPTFLSRDEFETKNFSTLLQFTSHLGVNWEVSSHFRLSYRFQHMSNAGLGDPNPGLNLHMLEVSYRF